MPRTKRRKRHAVFATAGVVLCLMLFSSRPTVGTLQNPFFTADTLANCAVKRCVQGGKGHYALPVMRSRAIELEETLSSSLVSRRLAKSTSHEVIRNAYKALRGSCAVVGASSVEPDADVVIRVQGWFPRRTSDVTRDPNQQEPVSRTNFAVLGERVLSATRCLTRNLDWHNSSIPKLKDVYIVGYWSNLQGLGRFLECASKLDAYVPSVRLLSLDLNIVRIGYAIDSDRGAPGVTITLPAVLMALHSGCKTVQVYGMGKGSDLQDMLSRNDELELIESIKLQLNWETQVLEKIAKCQILKRSRLCSKLSIVNRLSNSPK